MLPLARRLSKVKPSATLAVKMEADRLRKEGADVIDFGPGEPDFNSPDNVKQAAHRAIDENMSHYLPTQGLPALREAIASDYRKRYDTDYSASEVIVSCGGKSALFGAVMALFDEGDKVIIPAPYWVSFPEQVKLAGARPVILECDERDGFIPRAEAAERMVDRATRGLILCSPSNPTGTVIPQEEIGAFVELAAQRDLYLIFDECYERFLYDGLQHASPARDFRRIRDRLVLAGTMSKSYAMTGYRVGYAVGDRRLISAIASVQGHDSTHATAVAQAAALEALTGPQDALQKMMDVYTRRRDLMVTGLRSIDGITCAKPSGAFYVFPGVTGLYSRLGVKDSVGVAKELLTRARIATVPGEAFGAPGYLRFSYALSEARIEEGLGRLRSLLDG